MARPNLILPLPFLISLLPFHAGPGSAQYKLRPAPPTRNLMYYSLEREKQHTGHLTLHAVELSREMHTFTLSKYRAKPKCLLPPAERETQLWGAPSRPHLTDQPFFVMP